MATVIRGDDNFDTADRGVAIANQWRLTDNLSGDNVITNWEQADDPTSANIGADMSLSSGVFSFPVLGLYQIHCDARFSNAANDNVKILIEASTDGGSTWDQLAETAAGSGAAMNKTSSTTAFVNVVNSSIKVRLQTGSMGTGSSLNGNTALNLTSVTFIKLGASQ